MDSLPVPQHALADGHSGVSALFPNNFIGRLSVRGFLMSTAVFFLSSSLFVQVEKPAWYLLCL